MIGKTNMDEFAMGSSNENCGYGPVRNPWDRERVPGGSSGGSAAAVAAGLAPWAIGTDTGGSIRQPAALCGIVGLKPTYGAVSRYGMVAFASSLDQCGPLTRDVTDAALLLRHMVGRDPCDSTSLGLPEEVRLPPREDLRGLRFGVPRELGAEPRASSPAWPRSSTRRSTLIEELGGEVEEVTLPHAPHGIAAYYVIAPAEASSNLARYDGVRFGRGAGNGTLLDLYEKTRAGGLRRRGEAADHAGHVRPVGRLLRGLLRPRAAGAHEDRRRLPRRLRAVRLHRHADLADGRVRARRAHGRPARDVHVRLLHRADAAGRHSRDLDPGRARRPATAEAGLPVGLQIAGPGVLRERDAGRRVRARAAIGFDTTGAFLD